MCQALNKYFTCSVLVNKSGCWEGSKQWEFRSAFSHLSDLKEGACREESATLTHQQFIPSQEIPPEKLRLLLAELQKDFQLGSQHLFIITKSFFLLHQPPRHYPQLRDIIKLSKSYGMPWQRWGCNAKAARDKRCGPVTSTHPCQTLGMHPFLYLTQPVEVMKFLRKIHRPVRKQTMSRKCLETF